MSAPTSAKKGPYPHEKRVLRYAYAATGVSTVLALYQALAGNGRLFGQSIPILLLLGVALAGAVLSAVAVSRRSTPLVLGGALLLVLSVVPGGAPRPSVLTYAIGALFGVAILVMGELVHMTERYERAHKAVERDNVPEEHINRVTDEALKTLAVRGGMAAAGVAAAIAVAFLLSVAGPRQWRDAVETSAPLGVAVAGLALAGAASMFILARGATYRFRGEPKPKELLPDVE